MRLAGLIIVGLFLSACVENPRPSLGGDGLEEQCRIAKVVDGDTIDLKCDGSAQERVRIVGYDTPEIFSPSCFAESQLGNKAKIRLQQLARSLPVTRVQKQGTDRYSRTLAQIWLGDMNLRDIMVGEGLAVRYNGGRRISWCERLGQG